MVLVSIVIPTYNRGSFIERAVYSALTQTYPDLEVIVVDDDSTDDTPERIAALQRVDHRVRYLRHETNRGAQAARNSGIQAAQGSYIAFLDSDNEWLPTKLERQMEVFTHAGEEIGAVYCGFRRVSETDGFVADLRPRHRGHIYQVALTEWIADTSTLVVRREELERAGPFRELIRSNQEWDLCIRLAQHCAFDFVPERLVLYHLHSLPTISKDLLRDAYGYLDVVNAHRTEIVQECGRGALGKHYFMAGQRFMIVGRLDLARQSFLQSLRLAPFSSIALLYLGATFLGNRGYSFLRAIRHRR